MNTCLCGNAVQAGSTRCPRCAALLALGLENGATENEIRNAYRLLVKVWHPDRFQSDQKLKEAAEAKLKDVNSAFKFLTSPPRRGGQGQRPEDARTNAAGQGPSAAPEPASRRSSRRGTTPIGMPRWSPPLRIWPTIRILFKITAVAFVLLLCRYIWIAFDVPDPTSEEVARVYGYGKQSVLKGLEAPKRRFVEAVERDLQRLHPRNSAPAPPDNSQSGEVATAAGPHTVQTAPQKSYSQHQNKIPAAPRKISSYITVGSTRDEVLAQQGTPTASSENKLVYGKSELYFKDGSVIGWRIDPVSSPIRVKLWPASAIDPTPTSFTIGSSKDVVLMVQGTPTAFTEDRFEYGRSEVLFRNNRVVSWKEDPASAPLWAR